jgi:hypothetical protein
MESTGIAVGVLIVGLIIFFVMGAKKAEGDGKTVVLIEGSQSGMTQSSNSTTLPRSYNQAEGLTYSYSGWILVKDFTRGYGTARRVFSKGDSPGMYLDTTSNAFLVKVATFGAVESILIPGISAMKWVHFAIVVDQYSVDVYINGILRQHHTLAQLPKQNDEPIIFGPGWDGVIARVTYYAYSLNNEQVKKQSAEPAPDDLTLKPSAGSYFDISWYTGRFNSV